MNQNTKLVRLQTLAYLRYCIYACILSTLLSCCGSEDIVTDPCAGILPVTARFTMFEQVADTLIVTDTALTYNHVHFTADEKYDSYEWKVGADERTWTEKSFSLFFQEPQERVDVRLIAKRKPNTSCHPSDDGIDTLVRSLCIIDRTQSPIVGLYHGSLLQKPQERFDVTISFDPDKWYTIDNINPGCSDNSNSIRKNIGYRVLYFDARGWQGDGCLAPRGYAILQSNHRDIEITYAIDDTSKPITEKALLHYKFTGTRR